MVRTYIAAHTFLIDRQAIYVGLKRVCMTLVTVKVTANFLGPGFAH